MKMQRSKIKIVYKVWLEKDGKAFGEGPYQLLKGIDRTGSLRHAAIDMGMSYRKAWGVLQKCEQRLGFDLIERQVGGASGGYSKITETARGLMKHYEKFCSEIKKSIEHSFHKNIDDFVKGEQTKHLRT